MVADIEQLEQMAASELHARKLNAKEVSTPMRHENFIFPIADGTVKPSGGDLDLRTSTFFWDSPDRGEEQDNLRGESQGSSSTSRQDLSWYDGEARNDFWSISGNLVYSHHVGPRVKLYVPTEESFPIPLKFFDVTRNCQIRGLVSQDSLLSEKPPDGYTWSGKRLTRKQTTSWPDKLWPEMWKHMSGASERKEKQRWAIEKPKRDNAWRLRGIYFIDPEEEEFKLTMKMLIES